MHGLKYILLGLGLLCVSLTGTLAQNAAVTTGAANANHVLLKASGPYEDFAAQSLARNNDKVAKFLAAADADASEVVKVLPASEAQRFEGLRREIHQAIESKDAIAAAQNSATVFRLLVDQLDAATLVVPREVDLLDYTGYELKVLAASRNPDWNAIRKLTDDSDAWWQAIAKPKVTNKHLRATVTSAITGLKQAVEHKNLPQLQFGAQMVLDLVDMLEDEFKAAKPNSAVKL